MTAEMVPVDQIERYGEDASKYSGRWQRLDGLPISQVLVGDFVPGIGHVIAIKRLPGGELDITFESDDSSYRHVFTSEINRQAIMGGVRRNPSNNIFLIPEEPG